MTRTSLDGAQGASLRMVIQRIPHAWKRDEGALRRFVEAVLWIRRAVAPWHDLPDASGPWASRAAAAAPRAMPAATGSRG